MPPSDKTSVPESPRSGSADGASARGPSADDCTAPPAEISALQDRPFKRPQFSVGDVMVMTAGVAIGLAGGSWMPADIFAAVLGLATLVALLAVHLFPPETHWGKLLWGSLVLAYMTAVLAAVFRSSGA